MVRKIFFAVICLSAFYMNAQNGTVSPYSFFGIGELRSSGTVDNQMMGGLSMYTDSIHINLRNPAAYGKLRLTTYTVGLSHREVRLSSFTEDQNSSVTNLEYLSIGFPLSQRFGLGFGIKPFTSVGYNIIDQSTNSDGENVTNQFTGEGGLNQAYLSLGYQVAANMHIGATASFNFGELRNQRVQSVEDVQFGTLDLRESKINGFDFNFGATYTPTIKDKYTLFTSVTVNTQANLTSENSQRIGSFSLTSLAEIEVIDVDLDAQNLRNTELKIPTTTTLGLGFGEDKKWFLGAEYKFQQLSSFTNDFTTVDNVSYQDASGVAVGGFFIPDYTSFSGYFKRITYRAGIRMQNTGLIVNDKEIKDFGITFGFGLPLGGNFSNLNLGFELGRKGTTTADLIEESYLKVNLGLSLNDLWFRKRQID